MKPTSLEDFRKRAANDESLPARAKVLIIQMSYHVASDKTDFSLTFRQVNVITGFKDAKTVFAYIQQLRDEKYLYFTCRVGLPAKNYYRLATDVKNKPDSKEVAEAFAKMMPGLTQFAPAWGQRGGSKPKNYSPAERAARTKRIKAERKKFLGRHK